MLLQTPRHSSHIHPSAALPLLDVLPDARIRVAGVDVRQRVVAGVPIPFSFQVGRWILEFMKTILFYLKDDLKIKL